MEALAMEGDQAAWLFHQAAGLDSSASHSGISSIASPHYRHVIWALTHIMTHTYATGQTAIEDGAGLLGSAPEQSERALRDASLVWPPTLAKVVRCDTPP